MIPSTLANAVTLILQTASITSAQAAPAPAPATLIGTAGMLAASLKASYPNPSLALFPQPYWWWQSGSAISALLTYSTVSGDHQHDSLLQNTLLSQTTATNDFMTPDATGNDDQAWWALAAMTAAESNLPQSGPISWLSLAQNVFEEQKARWDDSTCSGGLKWKILQGDGKDGWHYKNAITNGLFFQLAARLYSHTNNAEYLTWAEKSYDWTTKVGLVDQEFNVYDGTDDEKACGDVNHDMWSYNVGVFLHGSAVLAAYTKDGKWMDRLKGFIASAERNFVNQDTGALWEKVCEGDGSCNTDQVSFKGVLARALGAAAEMVPEVAEEATGIVNGAAAVVLAGSTNGLGPIESFNALEIVNAGLRAQGMGGSGGIIGLASVGKVRKRSLAGRLSW